MINENVNSYLIIIQSPIVFICSRIVTYDTCYFKMNHQGRLICNNSNNTCESANCWTKTSYCQQGCPFQSTIFYYNTEGYCLLIQCMSPEHLVKIRAHDSPPTLILISIMPDMPDYTKEPWLRPLLHLPHLGHVRQKQGTTSYWCYTNTWTQVNSNKLWSLRIGQYPSYQWSLTWNWATRRQSNYLGLSHHQG